LTFSFVLGDPSRLYRLLRRFLDILISGVCLLFSLPVLLGISAALLFTGGPVLFRQTRIGQGGRPFTILKFRTMESTSDPYARKPEGDAPQITPMGRHLRRTGLDELPQLWNVLVGNMSLVGPRPEMPFIVDEYDELQRLRLASRPGVTGLWQISTVRLQPIHEHLEYDLFYLANRRLRLDFWIMLRTPVVLLVGRSITLDERMVGRWERQRRRPRAPQPDPIVLHVPVPALGRLPDRSPQMRPGRWAEPSGAPQRRV
jgi:lipopolysaccharide/colanic/teichoic acid biosynthesis glycosyltransferase